MTRQRKSFWPLALVAILAALPATLSLAAASAPDTATSAAVRQTENLRVELSTDAPGGTISPGQTFTLKVAFKFLTPGVHVYGHDTPDPTIAPPTTIITHGPTGFRFDPPVYPPSKPASMAGTKVTEYDQDFVVTVKATAPASLPAPAGLGSAGAAWTDILSVDAIYQVCNDQFCMEGADEKTKPLSIGLDYASGSTTAPVATTAAQSQPGNSLPSIGPLASSQTSSAAPTTIFQFTLNESNWLLGLLLSVVVGLALNTTPCVLPIIPLTVGYFVYQSQQVARPGEIKGSQSHRDSRHSAVLLSGVAFSLGLIATFLALGAIVVLAGKQFSGLFDDPRFTLAMGLFFVAMALGMFGVYPIQLPGFLAKLAGGRSGLGGAFLMGTLAAVLSTPCTGPVLGAMIAFALKLPTGLGLACFGGVGLGMALPYLVLTAAPGLLDRTPRSGRWTDLVKVALGFILLILAAHQFRGLRGDAAQWQFSIFASLALAFAIWLAAKALTGAHWIVAAIRLVLLAGVVAGICYCWPTGPAGGTGGESAPATTGRITWQEYDAGLLARAAAAHQPVLLDLVADRCTYCDIMARDIWPTNEAADALAGMMAVRANTSRIAEPLLARYGAQGPPALVVINADGRVIRAIWPVPEECYTPAGFAKVMAPIRKELGLR